MPSVTVEPAVFLFMFTIYLWYPLCTELIYESIPGANSDCGTLTNETACQEVKNMAQEQVSRLQNYISASRHIPAFFSSLLLGPFTDRYGRRPVMVISVVGNSMWTIILLLRAYFDFSIYYFIIGGVLDGMCGGVSTFLFASFAYIADTSTEEKRTKKIAITEGMIFVGGFIASVLGGIWADNVGFAPPLITVLLSHLIIILYVIFKLPEPRKVSSLKSYHLVDHLRRTTNVLCAPSPNKHFLWLCLVTFSLLIMAMAGTNNIFILFLYDEPFNWKKPGIGYFIAFNTLLNGVITLFALPEFNKVVGDYWTAIVGVLASVIGFIVIGVSFADWMLFLGATIGAIGSISIPTLRSQMSKMISSNCQGSLFSLISAAEILCVLVSSSAMSMIYEVTHDYYHGFCFLLEGGLAFLAIGLLLAYKMVILKEKKKEDNETLIMTEDQIDDQIIDENMPPFYKMSNEETINSENILMKPQLTLSLVTSQRSPDLIRRAMTEEAINYSGDNFVTVNMRTVDDVVSSSDDLLLDCGDVTPVSHSEEQRNAISSNCGHVTCANLCGTTAV